MFENQDAGFWSFSRSDTGRCIKVKEGDAAQRSGWCRVRGGGVADTQKQKEDEDPAARW